jgi:hypothetical protein
MTMTAKTMARVLCAAVLLACGGGFSIDELSAAERGKAAGRSKAKAPAVVMPALSADPAIMKIIDSLGDNCSAMLPRVKTAGDVKNIKAGYGMRKNGPGGRDYSRKMVWMPDRKRAIYCGAGHETKRLNDVWEYDLPSNTWVCLYAPDLEKKRSPKAMKYWTDIELKDGVLRTRRGGPAIIGHQWWQTTYDPEIKAMLFLSTWSMVPPDIKTKYLKSGKHKHSPPLWAFYPEKKRWAPILTPGSKQRAAHASALEYVAELKGSVYYVNLPGKRLKGTFLYDSAKNTWKNLKPGGMTGANSPSAEAVMGYFPKAKVLVGWSGTPGGRKNKGLGLISEYDVKANSWKAIKQGKDVPVGHDAAVTFGCDTVNQVCLLQRKQDAEFIWVYEVKTKKLSKLKINGPIVTTRKRPAYFDPARNVLVIYSGGKTWVYRYKRRSSKRKRS